MHFIMQDEPASALRHPKILSVGVKAEVSVGATEKEAAELLARTVVLIRHGLRRDAEAVLPRIEFIPLPRTLFLTTGRSPGSAILRWVSRGGMGVFTQFKRID